MPGAGDLRDRVRFEQRGLNAQGDRLGAWGSHTTVAAQLVWLRGSEPVMAQRLQGVQPVVIVVRASTATRQITPAFRAVNTRTGQAYALKSATPNREAPRDFIDILAEAKSS